MSILGTVVYEYIATGEPVGAATLTQKYNIGVIAATVRADLTSMADEAPTRAPSDRGYRFYVTSCCRSR
jgi:heat-inducible transcriptional repressor